MAKVDCFEIPGLVCWFWSDDHDPPHFHVKRVGKWEIKVNFMASEADMFELLWGKPARAKVLRSIAERVGENRVQLLAEWEAKVNQ
jgi:hypothetical protein